VDVLKYIYLVKNFKDKEKLLHLSAHTKILNRKKGHNFRIGILGASTTEGSFYDLP